MENIYISIYSLRCVSLKYCYFTIEIILVLFFFLILYKYYFILYLLVILICLIINYISTKRTIILIYTVVEFHILITCIDYYTLYFNMFIDEIAFPLRIWIWQWASTMQYQNSRRQFGHTYTNRNLTLNTTRTDCYPRLI